MAQAKKETISNNIKLFLLNKTSLIKILLALGTSFILLGFVLQISLGIKIHYILFILISIAVLALRFSDKVYKIKLLYIGFILILIPYSIIKNGLDAPLIYSLVTYLFIPIIYWNSFFSTQKSYLYFQIFHYFTLFYFLGLLLQIMGFESVFLNKDITKTFGEVHERYGSFAGGTLSLGLTASMSLLFAIYEWLHMKQKNVMNVFWIIISFITVLFSQSRRFYVLNILVIIFIYRSSLKKEKQSSKNKFIRYIIYFVIFLISIVVLFFLKDNYFLGRLFSIFDFKGDESNLLRVVKWLEALQVFLNNFLLGNGLGSSGVVGRNFDPMETSLNEVLVAESYFLKIFLEGGFLFGLFYLLTNMYILKICIKSLKSTFVPFTNFCFIFYFFESFMSTSLESILPNLIFWLSVSTLLSNNMDEKLLTNKYENSPILYS